MRFKTANKLEVGQKYYLSKHKVACLEPYMNVLRGVSCAPDESKFKGVVDALKKEFKGCEVGCELKVVGCHQYLVSYLPIAWVIFKDVKEINRRKLKYTIPGCFLYEV